ncbi:MAG: CAP domain-containing protein [Myxococcota bacterium]|nr:CAP domain-containing protein [Myxococcota bacterium]
MNLHRVQAGQAALIRDLTLGEIARIHSDEMGESRFFGHRSPNTGGPNDRLQRAAYSAISVGENLALGESLAEATQALLESVSHRRVMLSSIFTHVGLGLRKEKAGWLLTQLFARPLQTLSPSQLKSHRAAIWRQFFPQRPPQRRSRLDQLVTRAIEHPRSSPRRLLDQATRAGVRGRLWAWQIELSDLEAPFESPDRQKLRRAEEAAFDLIQLDRSQPPYFRLLLLVKAK